ncbi:hypothetical protein NQ317_001847 [Molorchus minor]|uniref:Alanine--tRNA ligase n=1 Tax=Molorchus minor TaxID=1323400 RepID=A0ABQ9JYD3_9CUCU|nr:hypothetical protein NQ317_001847 [Molorchus minor]
MLYVTYSKLLLFHHIIRKSTIRNVTKYIQKDICSKVIRKRFLDYFIKENGHDFVKSSPVVPYCDPTVAFVNAGMNQFKAIFLGNQAPQYEKVANSQKCIRVGGKHNDLDIIGKDGYHHTFFEMLGNWSFGAYFKTEACELAWDLLTNVYKLPASRLYVTYFKGDDKLGIEEDLETKEIWRKIGVSEEKILPFGITENFWEMGLTGPCGPCTEIHIDLIKTASRPQFVNKGLHDLTELWNIVFIQYNRQPDGTVRPLPKQHVDTGMGFERLTSILQGKISNYDTDNFAYLINAIYKNSSKVPKYQGNFGENDWNNLDTSYRILADHTRMITACLADGMIPEQKTILSSNQNSNGLVKELSKYVVDHLGHVYPEMERNITQIHQIIDYEEDIYKSLKLVAKKDWGKLTKAELSEIDVIDSPSFITAYKEVAAMNPSKIDSKLAFKLYDTYGLDEDCIAKLSKLFKLKFDPADLKQELEQAKYKSKKQNMYSENEMYAYLIKNGYPRTDDSFKYSYVKNEDKYVFEDLEVKVLCVFQDEYPVPEIESDYYCSLLLDKTNLYSEAGGQISDNGVIEFKSGTFEVVTVENVNGYLLHKGFYKSKDKLQEGASGVLKVNKDFRLNCMRNHTSTHLLNAALKNLKNTTCQKSSKVTEKYLVFDVAIFGDKLNINEIIAIEKQIQGIINNGQSVNITEVDSQQLLRYDSVTLIPGEIYPDNGIRIVEIKDKEFISREPCCGTHILNTKDIEDFCIISLKSLGRSTASIMAVTGERAKLARANAVELTDEIDALIKNVDDNVDKPDLLAMIVSTIKRKLNYNVDSEFILPTCVRHRCLEKLDAINKQVKDATKENLRDFIEMEMQTALESNIKTTKSNQKYIIHYLRSSMVLKSVPLQKATRLCPDIPILVISYADSMVKARCCIPKELRTEKFNAEKWMKQSVVSVFKSRAAPPKGQDGTVTCNMKEKKVHVQDWDPLLNECLERARRYIEENL